MYNTDNSQTLKESAVKTVVTPEKLKACAENTSMSIELSTGLIERAINTIADTLYTVENDASLPPEKSSELKKMLGEADDKSNVLMDRAVKANADIAILRTKTDDLISGGKAVAAETETEFEELESEAKEISDAIDDIYLQLGEILKEI